MPSWALHLTSASWMSLTILLVGHCASRESLSGWLSGMPCRLYTLVALEDLFAGALQDLFGNFSADCVDHHYKSPLYTPEALARSMVRFAPS